MLGSGYLQKELGLSVSCLYAKLTGSRTALQIYWLVWINRYDSIGSNSEWQTRSLHNKPGVQWESPNRRTKHAWDVKTDVTEVSMGLLCRQKDNKTRIGDVDTPAPKEQRKKAHMAEPNRLCSPGCPISLSPQNHERCRPNLRLEAWKAKQCDSISWVHLI